MSRRKEGTGDGGRKRGRERGTSGLVLFLALQSLRRQLGTAPDADGPENPTLPWRSPADSSWSLLLLMMLLMMQASGTTTRPVTEWCRGSSRRPTPSGSSRTSTAPSTTRLPRYEELLPDGGLICCRRIFLCAVVLPMRPSLLLLPDSDPPLPPSFLPLSPAILSFPSLCPFCLHPWQPWIFCLPCPCPRSPSPPPPPPHPLPLSLVPIPPLPFSLPSLRLCLGLAGGCKAFSSLWSFGSRWTGP